MKKIYDILSALLFVSACIVSIFSARTISSVLKDGIYLCAFTVIPSLFPFMVITRFFSGTSILVKAGSLFSPVITPLTGIKKELCGSFLMGLAGGFPNGAVSAGMTYSLGKCSKRDAEIAAALSNNCSLVFVTAIAGTFALGSTKNGLILLAAQFITVLINSRIIAFCYKSSANPQPIFKPVSNSTDKQNISEGADWLKALIESIKGAAASTVNICAFILVFRVIAETTAQMIFKNTTAVVIYKSLFEVTGAVAECRLVSFPLNIVLCSAALGFSGISVIFQVADACFKYGLSPKPFIFSRITSAFIMPVSTVVLLLVLPRTAISAFGYTGGNFLQYPVYSQINFAGIIAVYALFSCLAIGLLFLCYAISTFAERKSLKYTKNEK